MEDNKKEIRCVGCGKLLGRVPKDTDTTIEIKCVKCKTIHTYKIGDKEK